MIGKYLSNVDSLIKKYFRKKRSLLVMILVGQALLIGLMTFFCLTRDSSDTIQVCGASQSMILVWDFFKNLMMVGFLMWILGCEDKTQEIKIISPQDLAVDDDATMKIFKTVLLLVLLVLVTILMILTLIGKSITKKSDETMLLMNTEGDWEYSPSKKRDAAVKF